MFKLKKKVKKLEKRIADLEGQVQSQQLHHETVIDGCKLSANSVVVAQQCCCRKA